MVRRSIVSAVLTLSAACAVAARADIVSVGSGIQVRAPVVTTDTGGNNELTNDEYESNTLIRVWFEKQVQINTSMTLDHVVTSGAGTGTINGNGALNSGTLATNTRIDSYYLHFDPTTNNTAISDSSGSLSITFDTDIIGLALDDNGFVGGTVGLNESDDGSGDANGNQAFEGPSPMTYNNSGSRGLELGTGTNQDRFSISSDRRTITILYFFGNGIDQMRIFTATSIPEPATFSLFGAGALGMLWMLRKRRRTAAAAKARVRV
jgi:hypothetical protein